MIAFCWFYQVNLSIRVYLLIFFKSQYLLFIIIIIYLCFFLKATLVFLSNKDFLYLLDFFLKVNTCFSANHFFFFKLKLVFAPENVRSRTSPQFLLLAERNEKEMKVKPATSFKLLTIFIHKKIRKDSKQKNVNKQYLSSLQYKYHDGYIVCAPR